MSLARRTDTSDLYLYCFDDERLFNRYDCSCCPFERGWKMTILTSRLHVAAHVLRHWFAGHKTPLRQILTALWRNE